MNCFSSCFCILLTEIISRLGISVVECEIASRAE